MSEWPDDRVDQLALLRALAKKTPIDDGTMAFMFGDMAPWYPLVDEPDVDACAVELLDDPDPLVARRAIAFLSHDERDDAMFERFADMAGRSEPGEVADELLRVLARWARDEAEGRRVATLVRTLTPTGRPTTYMHAARYEPAWLLEVARAGLGDERAQYGWQRAAEVIASAHPEMLLAFLTALRGLPDDLKHGALDRVGLVLAVASTPRPTLAECRAAIDAEAVSKRAARFDVKDAARSDIDEVLIVRVLEAIGWTGDPAVVVAAARTKPWTTETRTWESGDFTLEDVREFEYQPQDVNSPEWSMEFIRVRGARRGGPTLMLGVRVGEREMGYEIDAGPDDRDRILETLWRTLGRPRS
jgi:hypothetical protein